MHSFDKEEACKNIDAEIYFNIKIFKVYGQEAEMTKYMTESWLLSAENFVFFFYLFFCNKYDSTVNPNAV